MKVNTELKEEILQALEDKKPVMLFVLAEQFSVSEKEVAENLPENIQSFAPKEDFETIWKELTSWEKATFILRSCGTVLEVKSVIPKGSFGHGYFNLMGDTPLNGHLKMDDLQDICFLSLPFMGLESHSVQFFDTEGKVKFAIYVGRENKKLLTTAKESFLNLQKKYSK